MKEIDIPSVFSNTKNSSIYHTVIVDSTTNKANSFRGKSKLHLLFPVNNKLKKLNYNIVYFPIKFKS